MYIGIRSSKTVFAENFPFWTSVTCGLSWPSEATKKHHLVCHKSDKNEELSEGCHFLGSQWWIFTNFYEEQNMGKIQVIENLKQFNSSHSSF